VFQVNFRNGLRATLIAVIVACALWIGYVAGWGERAPLSGSQPGAKDVTLDEIRLAPDYAGPGPDLAETTARPLFNASRRPLPGAAQSGSARPGALQRGRYLLTGVSISPGKREALLRDVATNTTVRVEQNKEVGGILVESVTPTKVTLKVGAVREEIPLKIAPATKVAEATPPKSDQRSASGQAALAGAPPTPPVAAGLPGPPQAATDIANADPITDADVAERAARVQARRNRQSASGESVTR